MKDLVIDALYGNCPVQAEGTVGGKPFYFRARGEHWSFRVAEPGEDPVGEAYWERYRDYHVGEQFAAGWMETEEALAFIESAAADFLAGKPP
jgi:hypothetical protein